VSTLQAPQTCVVQIGVVPPQSVFETRHWTQACAVMSQTGFAEPVQSAF
jgi:hypothetical protein